MHAGLIQAAKNLGKDACPRDLALLPNASEFEFTGCFKDGSESLCIVKKDSIGMHSVFRISDNEPCWFQLSGWKRKA